MTDKPFNTLADVIAHRYGEGQVGGGIAGRDLGADDVLARPENVDVVPQEQIVEDAGQEQDLAMHIGERNARGWAVPLMPRTTINWECAPRCQKRFKALAGRS